MKTTEIKKKKLELKYPPPPPPPRPPQKKIVVNKTFAEENLRFLSCNRFYLETPGNSNRVNTVLVKWLLRQQALLSSVIKSLNL